MSTQKAEGPRGGGGGGGRLKSAVQPTPTELLAPCPFCGGEPTVERVNFNMKVRIACRQKDECPTNASTPPLPYPKAMAAWNRREALAASEPVEAVAWLWEERQYDNHDNTTWKLCCGFEVPEYQLQHKWVRNIRPLTAPCPQEGGQK